LHLVEAHEDDELGPPYSRGWHRATAAVLAVVFLLPVAIALLFFLGRLIGS
jgi:hypothetical protein